MKMLAAPSSCKVARVEADEVFAVSLPLPFWKRTLDIGCCLLALPGLGLCAFVMAVLTRITSPGPILFRQERVGFQGRRFSLYKFRTMHVRADVGAHQLYFAQL